MEVGNQARQLLRKIVRWILIVTGSLVGLFIILVIVAVATDEDDTDSTASDIERTASEPPPSKSAAPEPDDQVASAAGQPTPATPEVESADVQENPEDSPEPGLSAVSIATLALFRELYGFRNDSEFHQVGFADGHQFNDWQVRLDDLTVERRSENGIAMSEVGIVPGELRTLADDYMNNGGCPSGTYTSDIEARLLGAAEIQPTPCVGVEEAEPSPRAATAMPATSSPRDRQAVPTASGLLEQPDESCQRILVRGRSLLVAAQLFCGAFEPGLFEGLGADGVLLNLWVTEALARDLLADRLQARQITTDLVTLWRNLIDEDFPAVRIYWGDVLVLTGRATARGVEVKFEQ